MQVSKSRSSYEILGFMLGENQKNEDSLAAERNMNTNLESELATLK